MKNKVPLYIKNFCPNISSELEKKAIELGLPKGKVVEIATANLLGIEHPLKIN